MGDETEISTSRSRDEASPDDGIPKRLGSFLRPLIIFLEVVAVATFAFKMSKE